MSKASKLATLTFLFASNENTNMTIFTKVYQRIMHELPTRLVFDEYGVSVDVKGWDDNIILHAGPFILDLGDYDE